MMNTKTQYDIYKKMGPGLFRISEGYQTLLSAKRDLVEIAKEKKLKVSDLCIVKHERTQYEAEDIGL
jgi:hypothetical protein